MTNEELDLAIEELLASTEVPSKPVRNKQWRKMKKNYKDTKFFNKIRNAGYTYRAKWVYNKDRDWSYDYIPNMLGSGFYIKYSNTQTRGWFKRQSAKAVRRYQDYIQDGGSYKYCFGHLDWILI